MKRFWMDFSVGVFVLLGVAGLIFLAFRVGNLAGATSGQATYSINAEFDNIGSVRVGTPVKSAGIVVGEVGAISLNPNNYRGTVQLKILKNYAFPTDSEIGVLTAGLLGEQYLAISPGLDEEMLANGDKVRYTQSAIVLEKLIGQVMLSLSGKKTETTTSSPSMPQ